MAFAKKATTTSSTFKSAFAGIGSAMFAKAKQKAAEQAASNGSNPVPAGEYITQFVKVSQKAPANGKAGQVSFCFKVLGPSHIGQVVWKNQNLGNEVGISIFLQDLGRFGYDTTNVTEPTEIDDIIADLNKSSPKPHVTIKVLEPKENPNGGFYPPNVYINDVSEPDNGQEAPEAVADAEEPAAEPETPAAVEPEPEAEEPVAEPETPAPAVRRGRPPGSGKAAPATKKAPEPEPEPETEEEPEAEAGADDDTVDIEVGTVVVFTDPKTHKKAFAPVTVIDEKNNKVNVNYKGKVLTLSGDEVELPEN